LFIVQKTSLKYYLLILIFPLFATAQPCRYRERIFTAFDKTANIVYGNAPFINAPYLLENSTTNQNLLLDIFEPSGDTAQKRALILFAHSGGFINGSKDNEDMQALCDSFSRRGYVTASFEYRLGFNPLSSNASERAVWRGIQDGSAAVRFFKQNAALYKIDTNKIFMWGSSAGAFLALGLAYLDNAERPSSTFSGFLRPDLGCKDCSGNGYTNTSLVTGIISCWGATKDTAWIRNNNNIPVQLFHGTADATVPFTEGYPFGLPTITYVRGSQQINEQLNRTSIYHEYYTAPGLGHEYWGTSNGSFIPGGPTVYWSDIITKAKDFMIGRMSGVPVCVLPVKPDGFTGNVVNQKVKLQWSTVQELNLKNIILERSMNGTDYRELITVLPKGINGAGAWYSITDNYPFSGFNYYRLKFVDQDGSFAYSTIVQLKTTAKALQITQIFPNPVSDRLNLQIQSDKKQDIIYTVFDFSGKQLSSTMATIQQGINNTVIPFQRFASGMYMLQVKNPLDGRSVAFKIIKQ
jgi:poly(3-hydroxybutyrate) depolymerase